VKTVLLDLNVVLDVILERQPGVIAAARLWAALEQGAGRGLIPAHGVITIHYILAKARGRVFARQGVAQLLSVFGVAPIDEPVLQRALALAWRDFEDAVCAAAAEAARCDALVTRDPDGFTDAPLPVMDPATAFVRLSTD